MDRRTFAQALSSALCASLVPAALYAQAPNRLQGYLRTNWGQDPFCYGSYSFIAKGARRTQHRDLAAPIEDRIFFAGEAAHPKRSSTVHAAYESGMFAAKAVGHTDAQKILVVGAGISGLTAAQELTDQGRDVTIIEARNRVGGRIWTNSDLGAPLDLGASWIHGINGNPLAALAVSKGIETIKTRQSNVIRGASGHLLSWDDMAPHMRDILEVEHESGASLKDMNTQAYMANDDYSGPDVIFPEGFAQILRPAVDQLDIRLKTQIRSVSYEGDMIVLTDIANENFTADAVVITVPLGVLKQGSVEFSPPLPAAKRRAIQGLGFGLLDKVYLQFDQVFWDEDATWIITPENDLPAGYFNQWLNLHPYLGLPIIMAFNAAQPARTLSELDDEAILSMAVQTLAKTYG